MVYLRSGGGPMTVVAVHDDVVTCTWFESHMGEGGVSWGKNGRGAFPREALTSNDLEEVRSAN